MPKLGQRFPAYSEVYKRSILRRINPYSRDASIATVARREGLPEKTVRRWFALQSSTQGLAAREHGGGRAPILTWRETQTLYSWLDDDNTLTNQQLAKRVLRNLHKRISERTISDYLALAEPPFVRLVASRTDPDVVTADTMRQRVSFSRARRDVPQAQHVYVDEKFLYLQRPPTRVRGRRGSRQIQIAPYRTKRLLFICALSLQGWFGAQLSEAQLNNETFSEWAQESLVPELRRDDVVYLDQLGKGRARTPASIHYNPEVIHAIRTRRANVAFIPRKTPEANPIELMFNYIEGAVSRAAPTTFDGMWKVVLGALRSITSEMIEQWFKLRATDNEMVRQETELGIDRRHYGA